MTVDTNAPERIWAWPDETGHTTDCGEWDRFDSDNPSAVAYIRLDLHEAAVRKAREVQVLVWTQGTWSGQPAWFAECPFGVWSLVEHKIHDNRISVDDPCGELHEEDYATFDEAKAAAQADYERRIREALE